METLLDPRQAVAACLDRWCHSLIECDDAGLPDQVRDIESVSRMLHSVMLDAVAELESHNIAVTAGFRDTEQLLSGMLNLSATETGARVTHAGSLGPRPALSGEVLTPLLPTTAVTLAAREIGPGQVRVITETMGAVPTTVCPADRDAAEAQLAHHARSFAPTALHEIGQRILAHLDPDGPAPRDQPDPGRGGTEVLGAPRWPAGPRGLPRTRAQRRLSVVDQQLAAPRPTAVGISDTRTAAQRNADALLDVCGLARAGRDCPSTGGNPRTWP